MSRTISFNVEVDEGNSAKTLGDLRKELEAINEELEQTEVGSKAFTELSDKARKVGSELKTIDKQLEGLEPGQTVDAFVKGFEGIAGSIAVATGTLTLFGGESELVQKAEAKLQSVIAIAVGSRAAAEGLLQARIAARIAVEKAAAISTKALAAAQRVLNVVLSANPIGLVIAAVAGAVLIFTKFGKQIREFIADRLGPLNTALEKVGKFLRRVGSALGLVASEEELALKKTKEVADERVKTLERELKLAQARGEETIEIERKIIAEKMKLYEQDSDEYKNLVNDKAVLEINYQNRLKEAREKRLEEIRKEREQEYKEYQDFYKKLVAIRNQIIKENRAALGTELTKQINEANDRLDKDFQNRIKNTSIIAQKELNRSSQRNISNLQAYVELADQITKSFVQSTAFQTTKELAGTANQFFSDLLATQDESNKEGFDKAKKYKIAQVITTSTQASFDAFAGAQKFNAVVPGLGTAIGIALVAAIAARTRSSIAEIRGAQFGSSSAPSTGGGGGTNVNIPSSAGGFTPVGQQAAGTQLTPQFGAPTGTVRAYVIGQDIADANEADARLNRRRTLGG